MFNRLMTKEDRQMARQAIIPEGAIKVQPKGLDVVFYLYHNESPKPSAMCFIGSAGRPAWRCFYHNAKSREAAIARQIESCKVRADYMAKRKAEAKVGAHKIEVGHIFVTCWGYDQTNIEFFKVIAKKGETLLIVQEVEQIEANRGDEVSMTGRAVPGENFAKDSKPYTVRAGEAGIKVEGHYASLWNGKPVSWTAYC
jgi:hypothetical protein